LVPAVKALLSHYHRTIACYVGIVATWAVEAITQGAISRRDDKIGIVRRKS